MFLCSTHLDKMTFFSSGQIWLNDRPCQDWLLQNLICLACWLERVILRRTVFDSIRCSRCVFLALNQSSVRLLKYSEVFLCLQQQMLHVIL